MSPLHPVGELTAEERAAVVAELSASGEPPELIERLEQGLLGTEVPALKAPAGVRERLLAELGGPAQGAGVKVKLSCTYCHDGLSADQAVYCADCLAPHHRECFAEHGSCSSMGCDCSDWVERRPARRGRGSRRRMTAGVLLTSLLTAAALGIGFAGFVFMKVLEPPPLQVVQHNNGKEIVLGVDQVLVIEVPFSDSNPPEGYASRNVDFLGNYQKFHEDDTVQVEWLNYLNRCVLLVRGLEEGTSEFSLFFPVGNLQRTFRVRVEGVSPQQQKREARQAELRGRSSAELRKLVAEGLSRAADYSDELEPGKEHVLWLALTELEAAIDAGEALRERAAESGPALASSDRESLFEANRQLEETRYAYERERDQLLQRYVQTFTQKLRGQRKLKALRALMRGIGNEHDVRFIRLKFVLEDGTKGFGERWKGF